MSATHSNDSLSPDYKAPEAQNAKKLDLDAEFTVDSEATGHVISDDELPDEDKKAFREVPTIKDAFLGRDRVKVQSDPIVWNQGLGPFWNSLSQRLLAIFSLRFLLCLFAGQLLSLCITGTSVLTTELSIHNWSLPVTQSLFLYFFLNLLYTPYTIYRYGFRAYGRMLLTDGWMYFFLAAVDVEGNFLVVKAYQYTSLLSCMLLDAWATPACMIFAFFLLKARYHWTQILGALICIGGLGLLIASDYITDKDYPASKRVEGDIFMLIGATCYGLSNSLEEFFVRRRPLYEVVGQMGFWGTIINASQGAGMEHQLFRQITWNGQNVGYLIGYTCCMLFLYTLAPILFRLSSSPFYNLSILTSDFYGLCFGLRVFGYHPYWLYFVAYPIVLLGLIVYFCVARPEASNMDVQSRGKQAAREEATGHARVIGESTLR